MTSLVSEKQVVSVKDFQEDIDLCRAWDEMQGCVEAAPSDCPYQDILEGVFNVSIPLNMVMDSLSDEDELKPFLEGVLENSPSSATNDEDAEDYSIQDVDSMCRLAMRIYLCAQRLSKGCPKSLWIKRCHMTLVKGIGGEKMSKHPWSLPNMQVDLTAQEADQPIAQSALSIQEMAVDAALGVGDNEGINAVFGLLTKESKYSSPDVATSTISAVSEASSPLTSSKEPEFFGATFHSVVNDSPCCDIALPDPRFYSGHRYNHVATAMLLRQLDAFGVRAPVFGVIFSGPRVVFHIDWATSVADHVELNSALYTPTENEEEFKEWDLRDPADVLKVVFILDKIRRYVKAKFSSEILLGLQASKSRILRGEFQSWRWDGQMLIEGDEDHSSADEDGESASLSISSDASQPLVRIGDASVDEETIEGGHLVHAKEGNDHDVDLLAATLALECRLGKEPLVTNRLLPSPPRSGTQTPASESQ